MNKAGLAFPSLVRSVLLATGAALIAGSATAEPLKVKFEYLPTALHSWFHIAAEKGYYKDAGLDVVLEDGTGSVQTIQIVASGTADIGGNISFSSVAIARSKGVPIKAIAALAQKSDVGFLYPRSKPWKTVKDFVDANAEILVTPETVWGPLMETVLKLGGVDPKKARIVNVSGATKISTYVTKKDENVVVTTVPPAIQPSVEKDQPSAALYLHDIGLPLPGFGLIASEAVLQKRPAEVRKFVIATMKGFDYVNNGHEGEGVDAVIKARPDAKVNREANIESLKLYKPLFADDSVKGKPSGFMSPEGWAKSTKVMVDNGLLAADFKASEAFTNDFVQ